MKNNVDWEKEGFVSVWVGNFDSEEEFNSYIEEKYGKLEDDQPLSDFSEDTGLGWYDHDFREAMFYGKELLPIRKLLVGSSYSSSFIDEIERISQTENIETANSVFILFDCDFTQLNNNNGRLKFLASVQYDINAPIAES